MKYFLASISFLIFYGCHSNLLLERYINEKNEYDSIYFNHKDSTFVMTYLSMGVDTVYGKYKRIKNRLILKPFYSEVKVKKHIKFQKEFVLIQFLDKRDKTPFPQWPLKLNQKKYVTDSLGCLSFPLEFQKGIYIQLNGPLLTNGGFMVHNQGDKKYIIELDLIHNLVPESFIFKIKKRSLKQKINGHSYFLKAI